MEKKTLSQWLGRRQFDWVREASPIGSRDAILHGVFEALWAKYQTSPEFGRATVGESWLKSEIDALDLGTIDQDIRHFVKEQFSNEGVKVSEGK